MSLDDLSGGRIPPWECAEGFTVVVLTHRGSSLSAAPPRTVHTAAVVLSPAQLLEALPVLFPSQRPARPGRSQERP